MRLGLSLHRPGADRLAAGNPSRVLVRRTLSQLYVYPFASFPRIEPRSALDLRQYGGASFPCNSLFRGKVAHARPVEKLNPTFRLRRWRRRPSAPRPGVDRSGDRAVENTLPADGSDAAGRSRTDPAVRPRLSPSACPSRSRLSAVATIASSFERGAQPSRRFALAPVAFLVLPSSGTICRMDGSASAARRTSQFGQLAGRHAARRRAHAGFQGQRDLADRHEVARRPRGIARPWRAGRSWRAGAGRRRRARRRRRSASAAARASRRPSAAARAGSRSRRRARAPDRTRRPD